jgi:hypothetical protein
MALYMTARQVAQLTGKHPTGKPSAIKKPPAQERFGGYRSSWEQAYARVLAQEALDGSLVRWLYEPLRLLLAHNTTYVPDFLVEKKRGRLELHEVKGHFYEKDRIKVKVAASKFPMFRFLIVRKAGNQWTYEEIRGA